jgi:Adenylate and Guanylate cyclase catalytic domain
MVGFDDAVERTLAILDRRGRVSYAALGLEFGLDDDGIAALRDELVEVLQVAEEEQGRMLVLREGRAAKHVSAAAERRLLTVLKCDLVSSMPLAEALDPEDLAAAMTRYHEICNEVIRRLDGHVAQWIGDGVDVNFGFPRAHEDDAVRAVRCGLEIVEAIEAARPEVEREHGAHLPCASASTPARRSSAGRRPTAAAAPSRSAIPRTSPRGSRRLGPPTPSRSAIEPTACSRAASPSSRSESTH